VQSLEPPTYDEGNSWPSLASEVVSIRTETNHLGVLSETGVTQWITAALAADK
jgi:hypothetical protein